MAPEEKLGFREGPEQLSDMIGHTLSAVLICICLSRS